MGTDRTRTVVVVVVVVLMVGALALLAARVFNGGDDTATPPPADPMGQSEPTSSTTTTVASGPAGPDLVTIQAPSTDSDPVAYAQALAAALHSYDTRAQDRQGWADALVAWQAPADRTDPAALGMLRDWLPTPEAWDAMARADQHASWTTRRAWVPQQMVDARAEDPETMGDWWTVTVGGHQRVTTTRETTEAPQVVTVIIRCDGSTPCTLVGPGRSVIR